MPQCVVIQITFRGDSPAFYPWDFVGDAEKNADWGIAIFSARQKYESQIRRGCKGALLFRIHCIGQCDPRSYFNDK